MIAPFTTEEFFNVFEKYNSKVFPFQLLIVFWGVVGVFLLHSKYPLKNKLIGSFLGIMWIWIGLIYHIRFFTEINNLAFVFGGVFILQGFLILTNTFTNRLTFNFYPQTKDYLGYFFIMFGLIFYPLISYFVEGSFERTIALGLPCPSTIFTFGFFMLTNNKFPKYLLIIPTVWSIVGLGAATEFGVYQDFMISITAVVADIILIKRKK